MAKVRIKVRPLGLFNGAEWPEVGEVVDLPAHVADSMATSGHVEPVKAEKPADKAEKRPASRKRVETREG